MLVKTANLIREALDWAVLAANGHDFTGFNLRYMDAYQFSADWAQGGPIIDRMMEQGLTLSRGGPGSGNVRCWAKLEGHPGLYSGPTPLIAAMRCFIASKLGETVDVPDELCGNQPQETPVNQQRPRG